MSQKYTSIRNIAIIAHVDHGKTTLTDALLRQTGMVEQGVSMDSNTLEQERGITIYAKNTCLFYKDTKINIVDTPGHADFGSEVERVLRSIDAVVLLVDAQEGPMPQTRFVLKKSLELGLKPIVVINKVDKPAARPKEVIDEVLELFIELGATDSQLDFKTIFAIGREGKAFYAIGDESSNLDPLLDTILKEVKPAEQKADLPLRMQSFNLGYDNFLGRLAFGRIYEGTVTVGQQVFVKQAGLETIQGKISKVFAFHGTQKVEVPSASAGDIVVIAGIPSIYIGQTICGTADAEPLPAITIDEPTIALTFLVNDSPFAGQEGKFVTTRQIRERLERELETNVGLKVDFSQSDQFKVYGRGELHIAVLLEMMRREGFELAISQPQVIIKEENGVKMEPFEEVIIDVKNEYTSPVISFLGTRKALMTSMKEHQGATRMTFEIPTRGLMGYRSQFVIDTKGEGILSSRFIAYRPWAGTIDHHDTGSMISMDTGSAVAHSLENLQTRGTLFIGPGDAIYEGMVIGNVSKGEDMIVNPLKGKQLTNVRSKSSDGLVQLTPPWRITIERGMEIMRTDELLEITPTLTRLRKKILKESGRKRN